MDSGDDAEHEQDKVKISEAAFHFSFIATIHNLANGECWLQQRHFVESGDMNGSTLRPCAVPKLVHSRWAAVSCRSLSPASDALDITARIEHGEVLGDLISEYRRAA